MAAPGHQDRVAVSRRLSRAAMPVLPPAPPTLLDIDMFAVCSDILLRHQACETRRSGPPGVQMARYAHRPATDSSARPRRPAMPPQAEMTAMAKYFSSQPLCASWANASQA